MMEDWKVPNVSVNLHLTPDAARILSEYASQRNRGQFISQLLILQRQRDDLAAKEKRQIRRDEKASESRTALHLGGHSKKKARG